MRVNSARTGINADSNILCNYVCVVYWRARVNLEKGFYQSLSDKRPPTSRSAPTISSMFTLCSRISVDIKTYHIHSSL